MASEWIGAEKNIYRTKQTFSAVPANSSMTRTAIPINTFSGRLKQIAVHTANDVEYDFSIFQNATSLFSSVDELYRVQGANQFWQESDHNIRFFNSDTPQTTNLFLEFTNRSEVAPSGVITLQMYIEAPGTGGV
jgi:hypothetical protein